MCVLIEVNLKHTISGGTLRTKGLELALAQKHEYSANVRAALCMASMT